MTRMVVLVSAVLGLALVSGCKQKAASVGAKTSTLKAKAANVPSKKKAVKATTPAKTVASKTASAQCNVQVKVSGMTCAMGCAPFVTKALKTIKGVVAAKVTFKNSSAAIQANGSLCNQKTAQTALNKAFANLQYKSKLVKIVQNSKKSKGDAAAPTAKPTGKSGKVGS